ncbi:FixJ family two-component response regulator [Sphingopyxis sp. OAS728]|uniref:response regulator transcription factor n=1 Tax=Sphingopyxis sp. OAS728 TaxID=2663823 RepID=UPI00178A286F|nr:LuxR C-terminal-related transcriptional regulator [Sphingopyxis sp. OAS728]MBE1528987.1 FixJ family two-component response regulator [Sphingopyxis sp. OAS728]
MTPLLSPGPQSRTPLRPPLRGYPGLGVARPDAASLVATSGPSSPPAGALAAEADSLVIIVDGDAATRDSLLCRLSGAGHSAIAFSSLSRMLEAALPDCATCYLVDAWLPGGLDFQQFLRERGLKRSIVYLSRGGDFVTGIRAMKNGAVDFLLKPVGENALLEAVDLGLDRDRARREAERSARQTMERVAKLTPREWQVMGAVAFGKLNKQIAYDLGISEITVKIHRGNLKRKLRARSVGELVRLWEMLPPNLRKFKTEGGQTT